NLFHISKEDDTMSRKRTSTEDPPAPTITDATAAPPDVAEPSAGGDTAPDGHSFADRVGQRKLPPIPDPFTIAGDNLAGVRLYESRKDSQVALQFGDGRSEDKPSQEVIDAVKEAGYRWNMADRIWARPLRHDTRATRIEAEQLYQKVRAMIRQEKGIEP